MSHLIVPPLSTPYKSSSSSFKRIRPRHARYRLTPLWLSCLYITLALACPFLLIGVASASATHKSNPDPQMNDPIIGIDLGTTYSCVAITRNGSTTIIPNSHGAHTTPSWLSFPPDNRSPRLVGAEAKDLATSNPSRTIFDVKRLIGRSFADAAVQDHIKTFPFKVVEEKGLPRVQIDGKNWSPEELSAMVLADMKASAEAYLGVPVRRAVITVPAYFSDQQRRATKDAGAIAGLDVLRVVNEPTAASLAYGLGTRRGPGDDDERLVLVYDLGGGTFDVSIVAVEGGVFEVLATAGDTRLGGEDFDNRVIDYLAAEFEENTGWSILNDERLMSKLKQDVEKAKRELSSKMEVGMELEGFTIGTCDDPEIVTTILTRAKFEELNADLFGKTMKPVAQVLKDAMVKKGEITDIVLVGGSTRIPKIQTILEEYFGRAPHRGVDPDEAVAYGAAVQGAILAGDEFEGGIIPTLIDVNPLTLGIETNGGIMTSIIRRGTIIPTRKHQVFSTASDDQTVVDILVFEGERALTKHNNMLGEFRLKGIEPARKGVPQIEVSFEVDVNGILRVSAADKATGSTKSIEVESGQMRLEDVQKAINEAERYADEDRMTRRTVEIRRALDSYVDLGMNWKAIGDDRGKPGDIEALSHAVEDAQFLLGSDEIEFGKLERQVRVLSRAYDRVYKGYVEQEEDDLPEYEWSHGEL